VSNDHLDAHFRVIFDRLTASHRAALEELRDGNAALARAAAKGTLQPTGLRMPHPGWDVPPDYYAPDDEEPMKIVIERSPYPNAEPQYRWTAYRDGHEDELSKSGMTPDEALSRFLIAVTNRDEPEQP
jgi:hypothetical protein